MKHRREVRVKEDETKDVSVKKDAEEDGTEEIIGLLRLLVSGDGSGEGDSSEGEIGHSEGATSAQPKESPESVEELSKGVASARPIREPELKRVDYTELFSYLGLLRSTEIEYVEIGPVEGHNRDMETYTIEDIDKFLTKDRFDKLLGLRGSITADEREQHELRSKMSTYAALFMAKYDLWSG